MPCGHFAGEKREIRAPATDIAGIERREGLRVYVGRLTAQG
jgi:hypothetical protein